MFTLAFTGHRPATIEAAQEKGFTNFISGMALGVDLFAAEKVTQMQGEITCAVPTLFQDSRWPSNGRWLDCLKQANRIHVVDEDRDYTFEEFSNSRAEKQPKEIKNIAKILDDRNRWMVDRCDALFAVWNEEKSGGTANCVKYALDNNVRVVVYNPFTKNYAILNKSAEYLPRPGKVYD